MRKVNYAEVVKQILPAGKARAELAKEVAGTSSEYTAGSVGPPVGLDFCPRHGIM